MCGIFGITLSAEGLKAYRRTVVPLIEKLAHYSESRGKEASGFYWHGAGGAGGFRKEPMAGTRLFPMVSEAISRTVLEAESAVTVLGHCRLMTHGDRMNNANNQPVIGHGLVGLHNGIVVNDEAIWNGIPYERVSPGLDSEVILARVRNTVESDGKSIHTALVDFYGMMEGEASVGLYDPGINELTLATNCGSLYYWEKPGLCLAFGSERFILTEALKAVGLKGEAAKVRQLSVNSCASFNSITLVQHTAVWEPRRHSVVPEVPYDRMAQCATVSGSPSGIVGMKRCTRCILPESFPNISFDDEGVCNFCRDHKPATVLGRDALVSALEARGLTRGGKCLVPFSGGRDSCYGLHVIKKELGLDPIAYTYDWGMVTDIARKNCARLCGALGVEHVIVSADIQKKRENIRKNVEAWMKAPHLGMVPLFMAGDKQFYYYANRLRKQTGIDQILFCSGNTLETTGFKTGFCGMRTGSSNGILNSMTKGDTLQLLGFYGSQFLGNPGYLNSSLLDTATAFLSSYFIDHDYVHLYHYLPWEENAIMELLICEYGWETDPETTATWRIGDGSAALYNYIYYTVAGFSENDTFRSNQIREGALSRSDALRLAESENRPRWDALKVYCELVGLDLGELVSVVDTIPKLYKGA